MASRNTPPPSAQREFWLEFAWIDQEYRVAVRRLAQFCTEHRENSTPPLERDSLGACLTNARLGETNVTTTPDTFLSAPAPQSSRHIRPLASPLFIRTKQHARADGPTPRGDARTPANQGDGTRPPGMAAPRDVGFARDRDPVPVAQRGQELVDDPFAFVDLALPRVGVQLDLPCFEDENIPATGPVVITANHPYGGLDGLTAIATIGRRRRDLRVLANPELHNWMGLARS